MITTFVALTRSSTTAARTGSASSRRWLPAWCSARSSSGCVIRPVEGKPALNAVDRDARPARPAAGAGRRCCSATAPARSRAAFSIRGNEVGARRRAHRLRRSSRSSSVLVGDGAARRSCSGTPTSACGCGRRRSRRRCRGCSASGSAACSRSAGRWPSRGRLAGRRAHRRRQPRAPQLHGLGRRLRLHRGGDRRPGQPARRGGRRAAARARRSATCRATSARSWWRWPRSRPDRRADGPPGGLFAQARAAGLRRGRARAPRLAAPRCSAPAAGGGRAVVLVLVLQRVERLPSLQLAQMAYLGDRRRRADRADRAQRADLARPRRVHGDRRLHDRAAAAGPRAGTPAARDRAGRHAGRRCWSASSSAWRPRGCAAPTSPARRSPSPSPCPGSRSTSARPSAASRGCGCGGRDPRWVLDAAYFVTGSDLTRSQATSPTWAGCPGRRRSCCWPISPAAGSDAQARRPRRRGRGRAGRHRASAAPGSPRSSSARRRPARRGPAGVLVRLAAPGGFTLTLSLTLLTAVVLGGLGSLTGALIGAVLLTFLPDVVTDARRLRRARRHRPPSSPRSSTAW